MASSKTKAKAGKPPKVIFEWNLQNIVFVLVVIIFAVSVIWSDAISQLFTGFELRDQVAIAPTATTLPGTPTPLPLEYYAESNQTSGILLGVVLLGVIIIAGTLGVIYRDRN
jgi:hypothetical protein